MECNVAVDGWHQPAASGILAPCIRRRQFAEHMSLLELPLIIRHDDMVTVSGRRRLQIQAMQRWTVGHTTRVPRRLDIQRWCHDGWTYNTGATTVGHTTLVSRRLDIQRWCHDAVALIWSIPLSRLASKLCWQASRPRNITVHVDASSPRRAGRTCGGCDARSRSPDLTRDTCSPRAIHRWRVPSYSARCTQQARTRGISGG